MTISHRMSNKKSNINAFHLAQKKLKKPSLMNTKALFEAFSVPKVELKSTNKYGGRIIIEAVLLADFLD